MGLRRWFWGVLNRGTLPVRDPAELVEIATLPLFDATLLTEKLRAHGLDATCTETYNVAKRTVADGCILVPRAQLDEAESIVTAT